MAGQLKSIKTIQQANSEINYGNQVFYLTQRMKSRATNLIDKIQNEMK
jgi:hypothetical protein